LLLLVLVLFFVFLCVRVGFYNVVYGKIELVHAKSGRIASFIWLIGSVHWTAQVL
jgi:hypothetical protein